VSCHAPVLSAHPRHPSLRTRFPYTTPFRSPSPRSSSWPCPLRGSPGSTTVSSAPRRLILPLRQAAEDRNRAGTGARRWTCTGDRSEEHTSELQSRFELVCRLLLEKKKTREI